MGTMGDELGDEQSTRTQEAPEAQSPPGDREPVSVPPPDTASFPPIADYAFLSDCEANCLVAPSGSVEWMCVPRPDSPSVFGSLLDRSAGHFRISPSGITVR